MLSIPGLKDLMKTRDGRKDIREELADLFDSQKPCPADFPSYLAMLAKRLGIDLLALVEVDATGKSAEIHAAGKDGLTSLLTVPRLDEEGVLSGLVVAAEPAAGKARVFSGKEVFPVGETWCDLVPLDSSVAYVFIPLASLPAPGQVNRLEPDGRSRYILATQDAGAAAEPLLALRVGLAASLVGFSLALSAWRREQGTLHIFTNILNEEGYSLGFVDAKGILLDKHGDGADRITADLLAKISGQAGGTGCAMKGGEDRPLDISPDSADDLRATAYPISAPGTDPQWLVAVKECGLISQIHTRRERLKLLSRFVSSIAHEIKNPLTGIAAGIQYLARKIQPGLEEDETVGFILSEINRLNRIVDDLYKMTRPPELVFQEVSLKGILGKSLVCLSEEVTRKRLVVVQDLNSDMPHLEADPDRLQQIFINIIKNAVEASPEGGTIRLELSRRDSRAIIRVTDSGPGISREDKERIFEPFYSTKERGSGLGLCISQRIVDEHGGSIRIETPPGGGASFVVEIPMRR
jgi:signal transduction histidine kinase